MSRGSAALQRMPLGASPAARKRQIFVALVVALVIFFVVDPQWVVQDIGPKGSGSIAASSANLNPTRYVAANWQSKILPTVKRSAVDLPTLLADLKRNPAATAKRYGNVATLGGEPTYLVKGSGRIVSVDTSGIPSEAGVALGSDKAPAAYLQLGPILTGTDVRDAMPFISFNQFADQVTYSEVATAINKQVETTSLDKLDNATLKGKHVDFSGAFTLAPGSKPLITPVTIEVRP